MIPKGHGRDSVGVETIADPGSGVALRGKWIVSGEEEGNPGFLVLTENVQVHCNVFLGWYVRGQLEAAHAALHKEFGRRFCERMVEEDPGKGCDGRAGRTWGEVRASESASVSRVGTDEM